MIRELTQFLYKKQRYSSKELKKQPKARPEVEEPLPTKLIKKRYPIVDNHKKAIITK